MTWFKYDRFRMASISFHVLSKLSKLIIILFSLLYATQLLYHILYGAQRG